MEVLLHFEVSQNICLKYDSTLIIKKWCDDWVLWIVNWSYMPQDMCNDIVMSYMNLCSDVCDVVAWGSAQIHCQCSVNEARVKLPPTSPRQAEEQAVTNAGKMPAVFCILSSPLWYYCALFTINSYISLPVTQQIHLSHRVVGSVAGWCCPPSPRYSFVTCSFCQEKVDHVRSGGTFVE